MDVRDAHLASDREKRLSAYVAMSAPLTCLQEDNVKAADQNTPERRATISAESALTVERERPHTGTLRGPADEDDTLGDCCAHGGVVC